MHWPRYGCDAKRGLAYGMCAGYPGIPAQVQLSEIEGVVNTFTYALQRLMTYAMPTAEGRRRRHYLHDVRRAAGADVAVISAGKSGRTWLRVMLSQIWQDRHGIAPSLLIDNANYRDLNAAVPAVLFTHGFSRSSGIVTEPETTVAVLRGIARRVFLFRDPRDVTVSEFFSLTRRRQRTDVDIDTFVWDPDRGLPANVGYLNAMVEVEPALPQMMRLQYEAMVDDPHGQMRRVTDHIGMMATDEEIATAVHHGSFPNMLKLESENAIEGDFLRAADRADRDSYKVRRGKVGGYRDYFDEATLAEIDAYVAERLDPSYGYGGAATPLPDG